MQALQPARRVGKQVVAAAVQVVDSSAAAVIVTGNVVANLPIGSWSDSLVSAIAADRPQLQISGCGSVVGAAAG